MTQPFSSALRFFCHVPLLVSLAAVLVFSKVLVEKAYAEKSPTLVMFTASWCASCRDVLPAVKAYAGSKGYTLQVVDVDTPAAQGITRQYGLSINQVAPPMVYYVANGKQVLVLDDKADSSKADNLLQQKAK
jgi:thioredoxin-like negative regulator of GroEL